MRRAVSSVTVALGLLGATVALSGSALAAPAPAAVAPQPTPGKKLCTIVDDRLREISGLVATKSGYVVVNDGTDVESNKRVFFLDTKCKLAGEPVRYSGKGPLDTEDLALSPDGEKLWIADIGDNITNAQRRERVAVWSMPADGSAKPVLHRLSYPEGKPHDAEALLIGDDGRPLIITKVASGKAEIFTPSGKLKTGDTEPVPMTRAGDVSLPKTNTPNLLNTIGRVAVTGAARSPDGTKVVLRTYADAFEYDVSNGDIVGALTGGKPRVTPLMDPFGEAISYTPDGKSFVTVSDGGELAPDDPIDILGYGPSTTGAEVLTGDAAGSPKPAAGKSWMDGLSLDQITYLIAAVGVIGALMVGAGILGIVRARKRPVPAGAPKSGPDVPERDEFPLDDGPGEPGHGHPAEGLPPGGDHSRGGVYGGVPAAGGVYGGGPAAVGPPQAPSREVYGGGGRPGGGGGRPGGRGARPQGGEVYGGGRPAGGGYGDQPAGGQPPGGGQPGRDSRPVRGGVYGGGRAEPPRRGRDPRDPRDPRAGRRGEGGPDDGRGGYGGQGPGSGREYRGDRY
ncbi:proline-rich domain-containing protein [Micromonospora rubida]|uniref:Proline-rich domain-containing protein n=1 Tax=Micromonospora rubida TaxID=2697657 RepID=A0ABW7SS73_9ACTN